MPAPMPVGGLTMASLALTAAVIANAYYQKKQFYPSVVYITKSNPSMAAIYLLAFTLVILFGKLLKKVFFGQLRAAEFEHLIERSFYAVTETCLAFTVFRDDFSPKFVALFTVLLFLKAFHWLADYRVDYMERSPVITLLFHVRATSLLVLLSLLDLILVNHAYHSTITRGPSVQLVFGFEYAILLTVALNIAIKYICHTVDLQSENPWENKAVYLLYTELLIGLVKVILYGVFMLIMVKFHTFPLFIIRPMYLTMRSFKKALNDVILSRRAIRNMNTLYPDATREELAAVDNVCIICREEMTTGAKKLPCGHIFHASCLRSWFQRQQTCPTCRMDILRHPHTASANDNAAPQAQPEGNTQQQPQGQTQQAQQNQQNQPQNQEGQQAAGPPQQGQPNAVANPFASLFAGMPPPVMGLNFNFPPQQQQQAGTSSSSASNSSSSTTTTTTTTTAGTTGGGAGTAFPTPPPMGMFPPFFPFAPFNVPPPAPPINFSSLTEDELQSMEGRERTHLEARINILRNIQTLLDAAVVQMNQYATVVASLEAQRPTATSVPTVSTVSTASTVPQSTTSAPAPSSTSTASSPKTTTSTTTTTTTTSSSSQNGVAPAGGGSVTSETAGEGRKSSTPTPREEKPTRVEEMNVEDAMEAVAIDQSAPVPASNASSDLYSSTSEKSSSIASSNISPSTSPSSSSATSSTLDPSNLDSDDPSEIRRRRLERFSSPNSMS